MADFLMPALGADMETGKVLEWLVRPGARVKSGDVVAVVETHKGAIDVECFLDGVIDELAPLGEELRVGAVLARVRGEGEAPPAARPTVTAPAVVPAAAGAAPAGAVLAGAVDAPTTAAIVTPAAAAVAAPERPGAVAPAPGRARARVTPAAQRRAAALGVDAAALPGTGADGAVTLADVELAAARRHTPAAAAPAPGITATASASGRTPRSGFDPAQMRQAIAAAMSRSKREIPHYYLAETIDFEAANAWLEAYNRDRTPDERLLPAVLLLKATARALVEVPQLNGFYEDGAFRAGPGVHVGWAVALRGGGLVAPAIRDADRRSLGELMEALRDLVRRARAGGLRSSEMTDPTVTVTSLGDRGAESVQGVIYPPQVAIVGFGRVLPRPWVVDGQVVVRRVVQATLAGDHRASDGHVGGQLLDAIARSLARPESL